MKPAPKPTIISDTWGLNASPRFMSYNMSNHCWRNPIFFSKFDFRYTARLKPLSYFYNLSGFQFCSMMILSTRFLEHPMSIKVVFGGGAVTKILKPIIPGVSVQMIYNITKRTWPLKSSHYKAVDHKTSRIAGLVQSQMSIYIGWSSLCFEDISLFALIMKAITVRADSPMIRSRIKSFISRYCSPFFGYGIFGISHDRTSNQVREWLERSWSRILDRSFIMTYGYRESSLI